MTSNSASSTAARQATDSSATRTAIDVRRFPWIRKLAADYAFDFASLAPFFSGNPSDRSAWTDAIARAQAQPRNRAAIAEVLAAQQRRRGAPVAAGAAVERLKDPRTVAVVTGQQAGLFGGPLFTLLKALTAIKLAAQVEREHGVPTVAIFWIEAEDHDWNEVRAATVLDKDLSPVSVALAPRPAGESLPVASICLDESVVAVLDQLESALPATEFRAELVTRLRAAYSTGAGMAEAFGRWMEYALGEHGLVVYDAADPASKPLVSHLFERELTSPGETGRLANAAGDALAARGYHSQVQSPENGVAVFHLDGGRRAIRHADGHFVVGDQRYPAAALVAQAKDQPQRFSPNVLLRPVVQDTLFPTICYVAGPNELAYLAQLRRIYDHFSVPMPLMVPRSSATIADSATLRFLQKYQLPLESLQAQDESSLNQLLAAQIPSVVEESFAAAGAAIEARMTQVIQAMPALDPTLEGAAKSTLGKMQHDLTTLHAKTIQAAKRRDETLRRQYTRARALTFPGGHAQERAIGFIAFQNQYGPALVDRLIEELPTDLGQHWIVTI